jgi:hypothetical protein
MTSPVGIGAPVPKFVPLKEIDRRYFNRPYYIVPDGKAGEEAFAVIRDAMRDKERVALAQIVLTHREHVMAIEPFDKIMLTPGGNKFLKYPHINYWPHPTKSELFSVRTPTRTILARCVVVASGSQNCPMIPSLARSVSPALLQIHASARSIAVHSAARLCAGRRQRLIRRSDCRGFDRDREDGSILQPAARLAFRDAIEAAISSHGLPISED